MKEFSIYVNSAEKMERARRRKQLYMKYRIILAIAILFLLLAAVVAYQHRKFDGFMVVQTISDEGTKKKDMEVYKDGIIKYNENQVIYYNSNGKMVWSQEYSIKNPVIKVCGDYAMIMDKDGNQVYVFNKKGKMHTFSTAYSITDAEVAKQGVVAVALSSKNTNYIEMYNLKGEKLVSIQTSIDKNGYPLDIALSPNGQILCASYFVVDGVTTKNRLTFYDFSENGAKTENILGGFDYEDTIVPTVTFLGEQTVCAFGDDKISIYHIGNKPSLKKEIQVNTSIKSIAFDENHFAIVRERDVNETEGNYTLEIFSKNGNKVGICGIKDDYNSMCLYGDKILLYGAYHCQIITTKGSEMFNYNFAKRLVHMVPAKNGNQYFVAYEDGIEMIELK
ncbi:MAG: DUF5711 family protein [Lachnospiraceae bacterium]|nr:DUF5711 family protein [Lachnospiraceae bacterium]